jgi:hypothetical protein
VLWCQHFGVVVMKVPQDRYDQVLCAERVAYGVGEHAQLDLEGLRSVVHQFKNLAQVSSHPAVCLQSTVYSLSVEKGG